MSTENQVESFVPVNDESDFTDSDSAEDSEALREDPFLTDGVLEEDSSTSEEEEDVNPGYVCICGRCTSPERRQFENDDVLLILEKLSDDGSNATNRQMYYNYNEYSSDEEDDMFSFHSA